jgi:hypothetical protein
VTTVELFSIKKTSNPGKRQNFTGRQDFPGMIGTMVAGWCQWRQRWWRQRMAGMAAVRPAVRTKPSTHNSHECGIGELLSGAV